MEYLLINMTWLWAGSNLVLGGANLLNPYLKYQVSITSLFVAVFAVSITDGRVHPFNYLASFGFDVWWLSWWLSFPFLLVQVVPFTYVNLYVYRQMPNKCKAQAMILFFAFAWTFVLTMLGAYTMLYLVKYFPNIF